MKDKDFDQHIANLYQQRQSFYEAPEVSLKPKLKMTWWQKLVILFSGCIASLGVFAIIQHLSKPADIPSIEQPSVKFTQVEIIAAPEAPELFVQSPRNKLPTLPKTQMPAGSFERPQATYIENHEGVELAVTNTFEATAPNIDSPNVKLLPYYRQSPKYHQKPYENSEGSVRLQYVVAANGTVRNVKVLESTVGRSLQRSSIEALKTWKYPEMNHDSELLTVQFDFKLEK